MHAIKQQRDRDVSFAMQPHNNLEQSNDYSLVAARYDDLSQHVSSIRAHYQIPIDFGILWALKASGFQRTASQRTISPDRNRTSSPPRLLLYLTSSQACRMYRNVCKQHVCMLQEQTYIYIIYTYGRVSQLYRKPIENIAKIYT
jgi:hypothetical protein